MQTGQPAVIIVTYNARKWIEPCIASVLAGSLVPGVIVVDNASSDGTAGLVRERFPGVVVIETGKNLGFGRANNVGMAVALRRGAPWVFLLNQDAKVHPEMFAVLDRATREHPAYGIINPVHFDYEGKSLDRSFVGCTGKSAPQFMADVMRRETGLIYEVEFLPAALWLIRRETLEQVGGFDPVFFMYGEDDDLAQRTRRRGWKIGFVPAAVGLHWHQDPGMLTPKGRYTRAYTRYLLDLKRPDYGLPRKVLMAGQHMIAEVLSQAIRGEWRLAKPAFTGWFGAMKKVRTLAVSRRRSESEAGPFLNDPETLALAAQADAVREAA